MTSCVDPPLVSVIVAAYRATPFLQRAVDSLQGQTLRDWEAILVDDASPDGTLAECRRLASGDSRLRVIALPTNGGPAVARNAGLDACRGTWVTILDADDIYMPSRLATLVARAHAANVDWIADNQQLYDLATDTVVRTARPRGFGERPIDMTRFLTGGGPGQRFHYGWLKPMIRRDRWCASGVRYRERVRFGEDYLLYLEWVLHGMNGLFLDDPLYVYTTRRWSSRSPALYEAMAAAIASIEAEHAGQLTPASARLLARRRTQITGLSDPNPLRRALTTAQNIIADALDRSP